MKCRCPRWFFPSKLIVRDQINCLVLTDKHHLGVEYPAVLFRLIREKRNRDKKRNIMHFHFISSDKPGPRWMGSDFESVSLSCISSSSSYHSTISLIRFKGKNDKQISRLQKTLPCATKFSGVLRSSRVYVWLQKRERESKKSGVFSCYQID